MIQSYFKFVTVLFSNIFWLVCIIIIFSPSVLDKKKNTTNKYQIQYAHYINN